MSDHVQEPAKIGTRSRARDRQLVRGAAGPRDGYSAFWYDRGRHGDDIGDESRHPRLGMAAAYIALGAPMIPVVVPLVALVVVSNANPATNYAFDGELNRSIGSWSALIEISKRSCIRASLALNSRVRQQYSSCIPFGSLK
jgi:hypothetical protein